MPSTSISLREATIDDLAIIRFWDTQLQVINAHSDSGIPIEDDEWDWENELKRTVPWREQLIAMLGNAAIGLVQIIYPLEEESHYWGKIEANLRAIDIWIGEAKNTGKGYGTKIMNQAIARCFHTASVTGIVIDPLTSNQAAIRFYQRLGFKITKQHTFGEDACTILRLDRTTWEQSV